MRLDGEKCFKDSRVLFIFPHMLDSCQKAEVNFVESGSRWKCFYSRITSSQGWIVWYNCVSIIVLSHSDSQLLSCVISYTMATMPQQRSQNMSQKLHRNLNKTAPVVPSKDHHNHLQCQQGSYAGVVAWILRSKAAFYTWTKLILTNPILFFGSYGSNMMQAPKNCMDCAMFTCNGTANRMRQCFMILGQFQCFKRT